MANVPKSIHILFGILNFSGIKPLKWKKEGKISDQRDSVIKTYTSYRRGNDVKKYTQAHRHRGGRVVWGGVGGCGWGWGREGAGVGGGGGGINT